MTTRTQIELGNLILIVDIEATVIEGDAGSYDTPATYDVAEIKSVKVITAVGDNYEIHRRDLREYATDLDALAFYAVESQTDLFELAAELAA